MSDASVPTECDLADQVLVFTCKTSFFASGTLREMSPLLASCPTTFSNEFPKYKGQVEGQGLSNLAGSFTDLEEGAEGEREGGWKGFAQRPYFGVRVSPCKKPFVPSHFGKIPNSLEIFQKDWKNSKGLRQRALATKCLVRWTCAKRCTVTFSSSLAYSFWFRDAFLMTHERLPSSRSKIP